MWIPYTPYKNTFFRNDMGKMSSVYLNEDSSLIKRIFNTSGFTASGKPSSSTKDDADKYWFNETYYLTKFQFMPWVPELVSIDYQNRTIIQKYYGPDLLIRGFDDIPDMEQQVLEIYKYFKEINVYKFNGSLSNMTKHNGRVIMFDFKYMSTRSAENVDFVIQKEIGEWLSKISPTIAPKLKELL